MTAVEDDEYLRWCVYCGADCWPLRQNQRHDATCPIVTGVYPLDEDDLALGMCCSDCLRPFRAGDSYLLRDVDPEDATTGSDTTDISFMICVDCAWRRESSN